jgi:hypothetical protein
MAANSIYECPGCKDKGVTTLLDLSDDEPPREPSAGTGSHAPPGSTPIQKSGRVYRGDGGGVVGFYIPTERLYPCPRCKQRYTMRELRPHRRQQP